MPRTSTNKTKENSTETKETIKKSPGRQKGQKVEREPDIEIKLNKDFRIKAEKLNFILQEKMDKDETEEVIDGEESKDKGWKFRGFYPPNISGLESICRNMITLIAHRKIKKEGKLKLSWEEYLKYMSNSIKEIHKMFKPLGVNVDISKDINEILKTFKKD